jgi:hypothetical protein
MLRVLAFLACTGVIGATAVADEPNRYDYGDFRAEQRRDEWRERERMREEARRDLDRRLSDCHSWRCRARVRHEWRAEHPRFRY